MAEGLVFPQLSFGHVASIGAYTDERLFAQTGVRIAFTTRWGGVSETPFDTFNLGTHVHDDEYAPLRNRELLLGSWGRGDIPFVPNASVTTPSDTPTLITANQIHGTHAVWVSAADDLAAKHDEALAGADAIGSEIPDVAGLLCYADCGPLALVAPGGYWVIAHAGWRGAIGQIASQSLVSLCERSGCEPHEVNAYIGPCIHACCFEVSEEIAQKFSDTFGEICVPEYRHVSLPHALRSDLTQAGMDPARIADVNRCTSCHTDEFFSYRASGGVCGRHGLFAVKFSS